MSKSKRTASLVMLGRTAPGDARIRRSIEALEARQVADAVRIAELEREVSRQRKIIAAFGVRTVHRVAASAR